jgi:hypothetical protein
MDSFRAQSLSGLLKHEDHPDFKKKIVAILKVKLNILLQGHEKRGKKSDAEECKRMLNSLGQ